MAITHRNVLAQKLAEKIITQKLDDYFGTHVLGWKYITPFKPSGTFEIECDNKMRCEIRIVPYTGCIWIYPQPQVLKF